MNARAHCARIVQILGFPFEDLPAAGTLAGVQGSHETRSNNALATALAAFSAGNAAAADAELNPIVVTAHPPGNRANELMADVTVIDREEIEQAGQTSIEQLLSRQPGIQYTANGGPGTNSGVFIRGASPKQSIVLIDGQRFRIRNHR